jgi:hypothetical protein
VRRNDVSRLGFRDLGRVSTTCGSGWVDLENQENKSTNNNWYEMRMIGLKRDTHSGTIRSIHKAIKNDAKVSKVRLTVKGITVEIMLRIVNSLGQRDFFPFLLTH